MAWGEDDQDGTLPELPDRHETEPDMNGIKIITTYRKNELGQQVKTVQKVKVSKKTVKIARSVLARRQWAKFGEEKGKPAGYHGAGFTTTGGETTVDISEQYLEMTPKVQIKEERNEAAERAFEKLNQGAFEAWRPKTRGDGVSAAKEWAEANGLAGGDDGGRPMPSGAGTGSLAALAEAGGRTGGYVPPSMRNADGSRNTDLAQRDDTCTVRVSNLSENVKDSDLRELFRRFGAIQRIYLAKDRETQQSRGFAFINFFHKQDAAAAIAKLDGHGYDHLILSVSWANPTAQAPQQAPPSGLGAFPALGSGAGGGGARDPSGRPLFGARAGGAPSRGDAGMEQKYDNHIHSSSLDRFR